jgi:hypothetical protein
MPMSFYSTCPRCRDAKLQSGFSRHGLAALLDLEYLIYAHCVFCDVQWPINERERVLLAKAVAHSF